MVFSHDPREIAKGLSFLALLLTNSVEVGEFKQKQKAQTYIRAHVHDFGYDPTDNKVICCLESQSRAYTRDFSFLFVGQWNWDETEQLSDHLGLRDEDPMSWVD